jgi:hypothetical protein
MGQADAFADARVSRGSSHRVYDLLRCCRHAGKWGYEPNYAMAALWAASVLLAKPAWTWRNYASSIFFEKLRAFRHLSGVALRLLMTLAALSMIAALRSSARGYTPGPMPPLWQCAIFPVLLLLLVVLFFLLDPLLSPNRREDGPGQLRMD